MSTLSMLPLATWIVFALPCSVQERLLREVHLMIPPDAEYTRCILLEDVDGDDDPDLFVGNDGSTRLYVNDGTGAFLSSPDALPASMANTTSLASGDVDGDGAPDLLVGNDGAQSRLLIGDGAGSFSDGTAGFLQGAKPTKAVLLEDVEQDGDLDAVMLNSQAQNSLALNNGNGTFIDASFGIPWTQKQVLCAVAGDVDGDGDVDILAGNEGSPDGAVASLFKNNGAGIFSDASASSLPFVTDFTHDVELQDLDADGDLDAIMVNNFFESQVYSNVGGTFAILPGAFPYLNLSKPGSDVGDVDSDGYPELWVASTGGGALLKWLGAAPFVIESYNEHNGTDVKLRDLDADGDLDGVHGTAFVNFVHLNDGTGAFTFVGPALELITYTSTRDFAIGDVDADRDPDVVQCGSGPCVYLFVNDGSGNLTGAPDAFPAGFTGDGHEVVLEDLDGDGDLDAALAMGSSSNYADAVFLNNGSGAFHLSPQSLPADLQQSGGMASGDVDADGDIDLVIGKYLANRLYFNSGSGLFTDVPLPGGPGAFTTSFAMADVDADGDLDLVTGNWGQERLDLNDGSGGFVGAPANLPAVLDDTRDVGAGDADGDGDVDLVFGNSDDQSRVLANDGNGVFQDVPGALAGDSSQVFKLVFEDLDEDRAPDLYLGRYYGDQDSLFLNDGAGLFHDATAKLPFEGNTTSCVAAGDLDADGDNDVLLGTYYFQGNRLYTNLSRQLALRAPARAGKALTLEIHGPALEPWLLAWSLNTESLPLPPLGLLELDLGSLVLDLHGILDVDGAATRTLFAPASPAFVGVTLYWQALVGTPPLLTNLEPTTLTGL